MKLKNKNARIFKLIETRTEKEMLKEGNKEEYKFMDVIRKKTLMRKLIKCKRKVKKVNLLN